MKHGLVLALGALALATTACAYAARPGDRLSKPSDAASQHLTVKGVERDYILLDARPGRGPAPLVIALHGGGGNGSTMVPRWKATAEREGLVVAFPEGLGRNARMGTWNAGGCCGFAMNENSDDVGFIGALIDRLVAEGIADPARIYVTGMSNGGMLTHKVAIAFPGKIAGAAVIAGAMFGDEPLPSGPVPMMIMHGERDQVVGFAGGTSPMELVARSQDRPFLPVRSTVDFWVKADACRSVRTQGKPGQDEVVIETHDQCRNGSEVVFYRLKSATHTWPGSTNTMRALEVTPYLAIDATETAWSFFKRHVRH